MILPLEAVATSSILVLGLDEKDDKGNSERS